MFSANINGLIVSRPETSDVLDRASVAILTLRCDNSYPHVCLNQWDIEDLIAVLTYLVKDKK